MERGYDVRGFEVLLVMYSIELLLCVSVAYSCWTRKYRYSDILIYCIDGWGRICVIGTIVYLGMVAGFKI